MIARAEREARLQHERDLLMLQARLVAIEFVLWAAERHEHPRDCIRALGLDWPDRSEPTWHDAVLVAQIEWRRLHETPAEVVPMRRAA